MNQASQNKNCGLNPRQRFFCQEFPKDCNATQAAIRAGYSPKTARKQASRLLTNVDIQDAISAAFEARMDRVKVDADYVLKRLIEIDQMDVADILNDDATVKPITQWPKVWREFASNIEVSEIWNGRGDDREKVGVLKKIKWPDKVKNLELLGKHTDVQCFREKRESPDEDLHTVTIINPSNARFIIKDEEPDQE